MNAGVCSKMSWNDTARIEPNRRSVDMARLARRQPVESTATRGHQFDTLIIFSPVEFAVTRLMALPSKSGATALQANTVGANAAPLPTTIPAYLRFCLSR